MANAFGSKRVFCVLLLGEFTVSFLGGNTRELLGVEEGY